MARIGQMVGAALGVLQRLGGEGQRPPVGADPKVPRILVELGLARHPAPAPAMWPPRPTRPQIATRLGPYGLVMVFGPERRRRPARRRR